MWMTSPHKLLNLKWGTDGWCLDVSSLWNKARGAIGTSGWSDLTFFNIGDLTGVDFADGTSLSTFESCGTSTLQLGFTVGGAKVGANPNALDGVATGFLLFDSGIVASFPKMNPSKNSQWLHKWNNYKTINKTHQNTVNGIMMISLWNPKFHHWLLSQTAPPVVGPSPASLSRNQRRLKKTWSLTGPGSQLSRYRWLWGYLGTYWDPNIGRWPSLSSRRRWCGHDPGSARSGRRVCNLIVNGTVWQGIVRKPLYSWFSI